MSSPLDYTRFEPPSSKEPVGVFTVEIYTGGKDNYGWELWAECDDWSVAKMEARVLKAHNFGYRIKDGEGGDYEV